ncbi:alkaline phosphatase family protein [Tannerella forsythia]|uniref:Alkaline phosphatase family protein n=1 Tax=Tannerella forsythia TaxID=28112 RepID=A0A3P1XTX9_TANFO|nr:alkaline phosphatase family protein [Tannerella forsythia]RRD62292.1 alkaline phosphatase family protein [Tannerella forsythia]
MIKFISSLIAILAVGSLQAQQHAPKLVVYITVDQLRGDYIEYFYHTFGERGFKRLFNEGTVYHNVRFGFSNVDQATAFATLFTGAYPSTHGITGSRIFDFEKSKEVSPLHDPDFLGNYTRDHYSPKKLLAATIGDELKIASKGRSEVYAIAPDAESAILSAGHAANGAFWLDNYNGKWATTTYYKGVPWYVEKYNNGSESLPARLSTLVWQPSLPVGKYDALPYVQENTAFQHTFKANTVGCYPDLKTSPYGNKEVNRLAAQFLEYGAFGTRPTPDMLSLTFYAGNFRDIPGKEYNREIQDTYHQLDKDLEQLLDLIDKKVGLSHTLVVLSGTGYFKSEETLPDGMKLAGGEFHPKRCMALLNMYLMAIYGQKNWINGFYNNQVFLNRKTIEDAKIDPAEFENKAAEFLREFSGVERVTTDMALRSGTWNEEMADFHRGTYHTGRGNLLISLQPGWRIRHEENPNEKPRIIRNNAVPMPAIFFGCGIKPQHIYREIKATEIAPTVTHVLRIRPPNACDEYPLPEIRQQ